MKKLLTLSALLLMCLFNSAYAFAQEETPELMSKADKVYADRLAKIKAEREKETNRFKRKAIENTEAREKKHAEALKRKEERASRFQKEAQAEAAQEKQEILQKQQAPSESRFTEMAKKRAEQRALKQELREKKLHRNQSE